MLEENVIFSFILNHEYMDREREREEKVELELETGQTPDSELETLYYSNIKGSQFAIQELEVLWKYYGKRMIVICSPSFSLAHPFFLIFTSLTLSLSHLLPVILN